MSIARLPLILSKYDKLIGELKNYYFLFSLKETRKDNLLEVWNIIKIKELEIELTEFQLINVINTNSSNKDLFFSFIIIKQIAKNCLICIDKSFIF